MTKQVRDWNKDIDDLHMKLDALENKWQAEKERADTAEHDRDRNYMWYRRSNEKLQAAEAREKKLREARPIAEWHEDYGDVLWWAFPIEEAPYCGNPLASDWPGYHTQWTPFVVPDKEEETKKYTFKATLHIYNGIRTTVNGEQLTISSQSAEQAEKELRESIESKYKHSSHLLLSSLQLELVEEEEAK